MRTTQQFSITLPHDMARLVNAKIASGAYASVSEVLRDGVRALMEREAALEHWLKEEVRAGHAAHVANPKSAVAAKDVLKTIHKRQRKS